MSSLPRNGSHLLDEAAIYYTATNTFRNPIFDSYYSAASTGTFTGESNEARPPNEHHGQTMSARNQAQQSHPSRANASTAAEAALLFMSRTRQKWSDFCDSLAFSLKARAFIMETNFKRRVRALRKFLDRRLSSVCWLTSSVSDRRRRGDVYFARSGRSSRRRRASQQDGNSAANLMSLLQLELDQASLKRHQLATNQSSASKRNLFNLSEPISAKVLGAQQECILSRLECIKRHNQKIGNMQQSSIAEETHEAGESQADSDDVGPRGANQVDVPIWLSSASSSTWQEHPSCSDECHQSRGEGRLETRTKTTIATTTTPSSIPRVSTSGADSLA